MVPPLEIDIVPEVVDEMFGILEGTDRFPSVNEPCQLRVTERHPNDRRVFSGVIVPLPLNPEAQRQTPVKAVRSDEP